MNLNELRDIGQNGSRKAKSGFGRDQVLTFGVFCLAVIAIGALGYTFSMKSQMVPVNIAFLKSNGKSEIRTVQYPKEQLESVGKMFKDVMQLPEDTSNGKTTFDQALAQCRQIEIDKLKAMTQDGRMMNFGMSMNAKASGQRSARAGRTLTCVSDLARASLCRRPFRIKYSKLVVKYMESNTGGGLGLATMRKHAAEQLQKMEPARREKYMSTLEMGKYAPGFKRIQALFYNGYLSRSDFSGFFSSPEWLAEFDTEAKVDACA